MAKKLIKMNESDLQRIIDRIISERDMNATAVGMGSGFVNELGEDAKPDFLDLDKDGDKEESMKKASKEMKEDSEGEETYNYGEDEGSDRKEEERLEDEKDMAPHDRIEAIENHLDALKKDMDYDEDHEDRDEDDTDFRESVKPSKKQMLESYGFKF